VLHQMHDRMHFRCSLRLVDWLTPAPLLDSSPQFPAAWCGDEGITRGALQVNIIKSWYGFSLLGFDFFAQRADRSAWEVWAAGPGDYVARIGRVRIEVALPARMRARLAG
jgi:hypothetical protein